MFYFLTQVTSVRIVTRNSAWPAMPSLRVQKLTFRALTLHQCNRSVTLSHRLCTTVSLETYPCHSCILNHIGSNSLMETAWQLKSIPCRKLCIFWINRSTNKMLSISQDAGASKRLWAAQARDYDLQFTISWRKLQKHHTIGCIQLLIVYIMDHARQTGKNFSKAILFEIHPWGRRKSLRLRHLSSR